jgi:hypothetical protein
MKSILLNIGKSTPFKLYLKVVLELIDSGKIDNESLDGCPDVLLEIENSVT